MSKPPSMEENVEFVERQYDAWLRKHWIPERKRRVGQDLLKDNLSIAERASRRMEIYRELLSTDVERHVGHYMRVAQKRKNAEMCSLPALNQFRERLLANIETEIDGLRYLTEKECQDASEPTTAILPTSDDYLRLKTEILAIVDAQIHMIRPKPRGANAEA